MGNRIVALLRKDNLPVTLKVTQVVVEVVIYLTLHNTEITVDKDGNIFKEHPGQFLMLERSTQFMLEVSFAFWFMTTLMLIAACLTQDRRDTISQVFFGLLYQTSGAIVFLATSIVLFIGVQYFLAGNVHFIIVGVFGVVASILHVIHAFPSFLIWSTHRKIQREKRSLKTRTVVDDQDASSSDKGERETTTTAL